MFWRDKSHQIFIVICRIKLTRCFNQITLTACCHNIGWEQFVHIESFCLNYNSFCMKGNNWMILVIEQNFILKITQSFHNDCLTSVNNTSDWLFCFGYFKIQKCLSNPTHKIKHPKSEFWTSFLNLCQSTVVLIGT